MAGEYFVTVGGEEVIGSREIYAGDYGIREFCCL